MLETIVLLQIDKNKDSYFPCLFLLSVLWSTTSSLLEQTRLFLTWLVGVGERKITTPQHVCFLELINNQSKLPAPFNLPAVSKVKIRVSIMLSQFQQPIWNTKFGPWVSVQGALFSYPIMCTLFLALLPLYHSSLVKASQFLDLVNYSPVILDSKHLFLYLILHNTE